MPDQKQPVVIRVPFAAAGLISPRKLNTLEVVNGVARQYRRIRKAVILDGLPPAAANSRYRDSSRYDRCQPIINRLHSGIEVEAFQSQFDRERPYLQVRARRPFRIGRIRPIELHPGSVLATRPDFAALRPAAADHLPVCGLRAAIHRRERIGLLLRQAILGIAGLADRSFG